MQLDPKDRERILRTLRWLTTDAEHRFNDCKQNTGGFEGGYSPELKEAIELKQELEQGELPLQTTALASTFFSEEDCLDMGKTIGMKYKEIIEFYLHYGKQGWRLGNGLPIVDLRLAMRAWNLKQEERPGVAQAARKMPILMGKVCGQVKDGRLCGLPAVYYHAGLTYPRHECARHISEEVKQGFRDQGYDA